MEEYAKIDLIQVRLKKEGYIQKDSNLIKQYLDKYDENVEIRIKDKKYSKYNKMILKTILVTSFGNELSHFLSKQGQVIDVGNDEKFIEEQLENDIKNNFLIKIRFKRFCTFFNIKE